MVDKHPQQIQKMFAEIAPRYDRANRVLSMRLDIGWRRYVARHLLDRPGRVLDLAAGTGDLSIELERVGKHRMVSADFTFEMLIRGKDKVERQAPQARQVAADALSLPFRSRSFDAVTIAFGIRNFADPTDGLREIHRVLISRGVLGILEFSTPNRLLRPLYAIYMNRFVPAIGRLLTGSDYAYKYLPQSVSEFPEGAEFLAMMRSAGFAELRIARLTGGIVSFYRGERV